MSDRTVYLLAHNPTDAVTHGYLPAARRLGLDVTLLTDSPNDHPSEAGVRVVGCDVRDVRAAIAAMSTTAASPTPAAVFTNSDHLQTQAALAAEYVGLPGKPWPATLRCKDKALMRAHLEAVGAGPRIAAATVDPHTPVASLVDAPVPLPCVVKPREGVASEDVVLARDRAELVSAVTDIRTRRPDTALVVEEYLRGDLCTLETLGDATRTHVLGGFCTRLSPPPYFVEESMTYTSAHPEPVTRAVLDQLRALGVGFGACHTEFVVDDGRVRLIEVNYRSIGDQCDLLLADLLDIPYFEHVWRIHLGEALPATLGERTGVTARIDYPCADQAGTLRAAPPGADLVREGVQLTYRPLRAVGEAHPVHHTNRDYLGVLRTIGTDAAAVGQVADAYLADLVWEITP